MSIFYSMRICPKLLDVHACYLRYLDVAHKFLRLEARVARDLRRLGLCIPNRLYSHVTLVNDGVDSLRDKRLARSQPLGIVGRRSNPHEYAVQQTSFIPFIFSTFPVAVGWLWLLVVGCCCCC